MSCTAGIDVGSTYTKAAILDEGGEVLGREMRATGFKLEEAAQATFEGALAAS